MRYGLVFVLVVLLAPDSHAGTDDLVLAEAGDRVRLHLDDGQILTGRMTGSSYQRVLVTDDADLHDVPRASVVHTEKLMPCGPARGSWGLTIGMTALTAGMGYMLMQSNGGDVFTIAPDSAVAGALVILLSPVVGIVTYHTTKSPPAPAWEPATLARRTNQPSLDLLSTLFRERAERAPARPIGVSWTCAF